jgi:hypothetical protein
MVSHHKMEGITEIIQPPTWKMLVPAKAPIQIFGGRYGVFHIKWNFYKSNY